MRRLMRRKRFDPRDAAFGDDFIPALAALAGMIAEVLRSA
jgi:hypothetical protein